MSMDAYDDFMGGGGKNFPFDNIGDQVTGTIISVTKRQQTDLTTGEPKTWPNGEPRYMYNIQLQTSLREDEYDDGVRSINVKWQSQKAVQDAVRRAGGKRLEPGGELTLRYSGNGPRGNYPQPPKLWQANYVAPDPGAGFMEDGGVPSNQHHASYRDDPRWTQPDGPAATQPQSRDHHGNPQPAEPPEWARPEAQPSVSARPVTRSTLDSMRQSPANLPGDRAQYGF